MKTVNIYTDGACSGNQNENNIGGWGCILEFGSVKKELNGGELNTTNNRMELMALISGLKALKEKGLNINVFSDSSYLINCFKEGWYKKWLVNGWKTSGKKDVENRELWEELLGLMEGQSLNFTLVKGHLSLNAAESTLKSEYARFCKNNGPSFNYDEWKAIVAMNNIADELATKFQKENKIEGPAYKLPQAVIFDLDGTLWDSSKEVTDSWNIALKKFYPEIDFEFTPEILQKCMGLTMTNIAKVCFPDMEEQKRAEVLQCIEKFEVTYLLTHPGRLFEKEADSLKELSKSRDLYIASNCQCGYIESFLVSTDMSPYFKGYICFGDTGLDKGDNIKKLMAERNIPEAVLVGDTRMDMEAAEKAGVPFILAAYGFGGEINTEMSINGIYNLLDMR